MLDLSRRKLTVDDVAKNYRVRPSWIYARADQLGAFRLGTGPEAPLRFDPDKVDAAFKALAAESTSAPEPTKPPRR